MFEDVPSISVPDANNVYHPFLDTTIASNAAAASDITQGKLAYVNGLLVTGTNQGGGGGESWSWMGKNPTKVHTFTSEHVLLKDSGFNTWTWTTTATTIRSQQNLTQITVDNLHDYIFLVRFYVHFDYGSWTLNRAPYSYSSVGFSYVFRQSSNLANVGAETTDSLAQGSKSNVYGLYYYNSSSNKGYSSTNQRGLYLSNPSNITIADGTTSTPKLTCKAPDLIARGDNTYFNQTAFNNLDKNTSYYDATYELWSVDAGTYEAGWQRKEAVHILNNGI